MRKLKRKKLTRQQTLSILMATVNGVNSFAPLAAPLATALTETPRRETVDEAWLTNIRRGGQILDSLLFTTAYAYTTPVSSGTIVSGETVDSPSQEVLGGGTATSTIINSSGTQFVLSGGLASSTTVMSGGIMALVAGGSATNASLAAGYVLQADTSATDLQGRGSPPPVYVDWKNPRGNAGFLSFVKGREVHHRRSCCITTATRTRLSQRLSECRWRGSRTTSNYRAPPCRDLIFAPECLCRIDKRGGCCMSEDGQKSTQKVAVPIFGYVALLFAIIFFSGVFANAKGGISALDFNAINGTFGTMKDAAKASFYGAGGIGARDGFLFAITLFPGVMLALGIIEIVDHLGGLKAAQKLLTPVLKPLLGIPGIAGLALVTSLQSTDAGAGMTRALRESGQLTEKEKHIFAAFQFSSGASITNYLTIGSALFAFIKLPIIAPLAVIFVCKIIGTNLMRMYLNKFAKEDAANDKQIVS